MCSCGAGSWVCLPAIITPSGLRESMYKLKNKRERRPSEDARDIASSMEDPPIELECEELSQPQ